MKKLPTISQSFNVKYEYQLYFTEHLFEVENNLLSDLVWGYSKKDGAKILFVVDSNVIKLHPQLKDSMEAYCQAKKTFEYKGLITVEGGEISKNDIAIVNEIHEAINTQHICRHSFVVAVGGGAVIDMVGYAAATAHRGVKLIRVPTTVLAQNDAAVGVKNGVNAFGKKNFIGTFTVPYAIINDFSFLSTLDQRDWISGIAEAVKVSLIKDSNFFKMIEENANKLAAREKEPMMALIHRCAEIHMQHIAKNGDPFESGSSRPLDFGHWAAHKLEQMTQFKLRHGEAVAIGIALDVTYANLIDLIDNKTRERIINVLRNIGFDLTIPLKYKSEFDSLLNGLEEFREHLGGELTITLITGIGKQHDVHEIDLEQMHKAIALLSIQKQELSL